MQTNEIQIIHSLLMQVGGPIGYRDLPINFNGGDEFYKKWDIYVNRVLLDLGNLNEDESIFLVSTVEFILKKIGWELSTVTKYSEQEILEAVSNLKKELKNAKDGMKLNDYLPSELQK